MDIMDLSSLKIQLTGSPGHILSGFLQQFPDLYYSLQHMHGIKSQVGLHQACGLLLLGQQFDGGDILNIGCAYGYSTACLASLSPHSRITSLDVNAKRLQIAKQALSKYKNVQLVKEKSWDFLARNRKKKWDMIFVDGCHREIWRDMPFYNTLVTGGMFLSHDYIPHRFPFVVKALDSLTVQFERPFDVSIIDDRNCGVVGMERRDNEIWRSPKDYQ